MGSNIPIVCEHGILGKGKCKKCERRYNREYLRKYYMIEEKRLKRNKRTKLRRYNNDNFNEERKKYRNDNKERINLYQRERKKKIKLELINMLEGICKDCELKAIEDNLCIFTFHHMNPLEKDSKQDIWRKDFKLKVREGKIVLLCSNCHLLRHFGGL